MNHLVIVAPNWLGDAVMALPAIADVRRAWPETRITIAARPSIAPLFALVPGTGDVMVSGGRRASSSAEAEQFRESSFDAALLLTNSFHTAFVTWRAGIRERWGYRADWRGPLLTRPIARPFGLHQTAFYQDLVRQLGFTNGPALPELESSPDVKRRGAEILKTVGWDGRQPLVALAPGAAYGGAKRWPIDSFAAVIADLARHDRIGIVLVGSAADRSAGDELRRALPGDVKPMDLIGETDLPALAGVLVNCRGLVTNDSGAMHVAAALGVSVTAMFGPTNERETRPLGAAEVAVLTHPVWCRPCMLRECPLTHGCMRGVTADRVLAAVRRTL